MVVLFARNDNRANMQQIALAMMIAGIAPIYDAKSTSKPFNSFMPRENPSRVVNRSEN